MTIFSSIFLINVFFILVRGQLVEKDFKAIHTYVNAVFNNENPHWVPENFTLVSTTPLPVVKAVPRCGEGGSRGIKICVRYDECDPATKAVKDPQVYVQLTSVHEVDKGDLETECNNLMDTCCFLYPPNPTTIKPTTSNSSTTNSNTFQLTTPTPTTNKPTEISISYCGKRNYQGLNSSITVKNDEAQYGEFPWVIAIVKTQYNPILNESALDCSGSLIHPGVVLTASYCVQQYIDKPNQLKVLAGEWDSLSEQEIYPTQERGVTKIIIHENYDPNTGANNFALIFLDNIFAPAKNIQTICLPLHKQHIESRNCFITEWGQDRFNNRTLNSNILKKLELPIVPRDICQQQFRANQYGPDYLLPESMVCAGGYTSENCIGDPGTPLICPDPHNKNRYIQVGILIGGLTCGNGPRAYANIARARHWIDDKISMMGYDSITYAR
ncbi:phenoloxidase-activating factor 2-like [Onthophagus taurus]|uniref:phenoloxidase-activating factor 2-like n=1 Tax=Onthophagus taurus TaxID=166361 RepID=UPI0039BDFEA2